MSIIFKKIVDFFSFLHQKDYWKQFNIVYITLLYLSFTVLITYPVSFNINRLITGYFATDLPRTGIFSLWWVKKCLMEKHMFSLYIDRINYPVGGVLYPVDPLSAIYALILSPFCSFPADYNLIFLINLAGGALATYFLVYYLTRNRLGAFVGGIILGFCPARFSSYIDGVSEFVHIMWIPLFVLYIFRLYREKERELDNILSCGILFFLTIFSSWYYGLFALMLATALFLYHLFWYHDTKKDKAGVVKKTILALSLGTILIYPFALSQQLTLKQQGGSRQGDVLMRGSDKNYTFIRVNSPDLLDFFSRGQGEATNRFFPYHQIVYLGLVAILLALTGLISNFRKGDVIFWTVLLLLFFILTLGPTLTIGNKCCHLWALANKKYLGLYAYFGKFFPYFKVSNHPYRMALLVNMALAVLAGFGVAWITGKIKSAFVKTAITVLIGFIIIIEYVYFSPLPRPFPFSVIEKPLLYRIMARDKDDYSIIDLPFMFLKDQKLNVKYQANQIYIYYLTIHKKPIPCGWGVTFPYSTEGNSFLRYLLSMSDIEAPPDTNFFDSFGKMPKQEMKAPPDFQIYDDIKKLKAMNYRYIILHKGLIPEENVLKFSKFLDRFLGDPVKQKDRWIYVL